MRYAQNVEEGMDLVKLLCNIRVHRGEWFGQWAVGQGRHPNTKQQTEKQQGPFWCGILKLIWIAITLPPTHWPLSSGHLGPGNLIISDEEVQFYGSKCCRHVTCCCLCVCLWLTVIRASQSLTRWTHSLDSPAVLFSLIVYVGPYHQKQ